MRPTSAACLLVLLCTGCTASLINQRVLNEFTAALQEDNESAFRRITSTRFEQTAMRSDSAFRDLEILDLPTQKLSIVESETIDDNTRSVVVSEEDGEKYQFRIVRDPSKQRWVVDDVLLRQDGKDARSTKSATEIMDLLLTLREFLSTLKSADRDEILAMSDTEFREPLESLPEPWLQTLFGRVTSEYESGMVRRPEAQLNGSEAVVKLPARHGFMLLQIVRKDQQWLIRNVEVHNRREDDHPGSVRNQAVALAAVADFLRAYNRDDRETLQTLATPEFFENSLRVGDFRTLPLPQPDTTESEFSIRSFAGQFTLLLPVAETMYRFDLAAADGSDPVNAATDSRTVESSRYVVRDLTIYDRRTNHQRTLSSTFTAPVRAELFLKALHEQNLDVLRQLSTRDLTVSTWKRLNPDLFALISLAGVPEGATSLVGTRVNGTATELQLEASNGQLLGVTMQDDSGRLSVSDLTFPHPTAGVVSLQEFVSLQLPIASLALAWQQQDQAEVQRACSMEFNRLVWSNVNQLPNAFAQVPLLLLSPVDTFDVRADEAEVRLAAGPRSRVAVRLLKEHDAWVIDEVSVPTSSGQQVNVRESLRSDIARNILHAPRGVIRTVSHTQVDEPGTAGDAASGYSVNGGQTASAPGNFTMPPLPRPVPTSPEPPPAATNTARPARPVSHALFEESEGDDAVIRFGPDPQAGPQAEPAAAASAPLRNPPPPRRRPGSRLSQPAPRPSTGVNRDSSPAASGSPTLSAGPASAGTSRTDSVPVTEIDGVTYFGAPPSQDDAAEHGPSQRTTAEQSVPHRAMPHQAARPATTPGSSGLNPAGAPPRSVPRITDPAQYPIDTTPR